MIKLEYITSTDNKVIEFDEKIAFFDVEYSNKSIRVSIFTRQLDLLDELKTLGKEPINIKVSKNGNIIFQLDDYKRYPESIKYNTRMRLPYGYFTEFRIVVDISKEIDIEEEM